MDHREGNGPTSAAAWHKCLAGQLFQLLTETTPFLRQEGASLDRGDRFDFVRSVRLEFRSAQISSNSDAA